MADKQWYIVQAYSNFERKVADSIREQAKQRHLDHLFGVALPAELDQSTTEAVTHAARETTGATHCLAVLIELDDGPDRMDFGGTIHIGIATAGRTEYRRSRILGGREWVRLGAVELALDCLRRFLQGLPVNERSDFEKT